MKTCESYFISEVQSQVRFNSENLTDEDIYSSKSTSSYHLWNTRGNIPSKEPENDNVSISQINTLATSSEMIADNLYSSPTNGSKIIATGRSDQQEIKMSDSSSITNEENRSDEIEDLLSMKVSKDYINCVWTNEPLSCNQFDVQSSAGKLVIPDATAPSDKLTSNTAADDKQQITQDKKVTSNPVKKKQKLLRNNEAAVGPVKRICMKSKEKKTNKMSFSQKNYSKSLNIASSSKQQESAAEICENSEEIAILQVPKISPEKLTDPTFNTLEDISDYNLFDAYKNLIVNRTIPVYSPKQSTRRNYKGSYFACKACGDMFILETSFTCHMKRKTLKFAYKCPVCKTHLLFDNRCSLLAHIISHGMNAKNLQPGELLFLPMAEDESECEALFKHTSCTSFNCPECDGPVSSLKLHFQGIESSDHTQRKEVSKVDHSLKCKKCNYILPTKCALIAHKRFHMMKPPHLCPDCGEVFISASVLFNHMEEDCLHHLKRSLFECGDCRTELLTLDSLTEHLVSQHVKKFFVCHICGDKIDLLEDFNKHRISKHKLPGVAQNSEIGSLCARVECEKCPDICFQAHAAIHARDPKFVKNVFQCSCCKLTFSTKILLLSHTKECKGEGESDPNVSTCEVSTQELPENITSLVMPTVHREISNTDKSEPVLFSGNCDLGDKCDARQEDYDKSESNIVNGSQDGLVSGVVSLQIPEKEAICKLCKKVVSVGMDKVALKKHFSTVHLDIFLNAIHQERCRLSLQQCSTKATEVPRKINKRVLKNFLLCIKNNDFSKPEMKMAKKKKAAKGFNARKPSFKDRGRTAQTMLGRFECYKCLFKSEDPKTFKTHILTHKSNQSDLQCPECGLCFIVRPPLEKHLIVGHGIRSVRKYLVDHGFQESSSDCEEESVVDVETLDTEEVQENQCTVCRQQFENALMLQKHFRVHGGAFLLAKLKARQSSQ
ncbi:Zinc finger protein 592 [Frankliniella fusca]|uniref:Zinc finger protein 592 n=1 Tax=Frankliniella fusca TaxID=407009 RepID=A0AAE1HGD2_9NEOP|nr:Zinc finger protein 592 [Frankliniella fusca]